jgi:Nitroreductase
MKKLFFAVIINCLIVLSACTGKCDNAPTTSNSTTEIVMENILNRRSIRDYKPNQVSMDTIDTILKAAINAPSARNHQPWEVRVIRDAELLSSIKAINGNAFHNAPMVIVVAYDKNNPYGAFDCGLLTQNILLSAESFDLGTCVLGNFARALNSGTPEANEIVKLLDFSEGYEIIVGVEMGYKNEYPDAKPRETNKVRVL